MRIVANPASRSVPAPQYLAVAHATSPYITVYPWKTNVDGFGTKYADIPSGGPNNSTGDPCWVGANNTDILFSKGGLTGEPYMYAYSWTFYGFGTKYADAANDPDEGVGGLALNQNARDVAVSWSIFDTTTGATAGVQSFPFTSGTGWGTKYAAPPSRPSSASNSARGLAFRPQRNALSVAMNQSPFLYVVGYNSGSGGFTTKFADPGAAILPPAQTTETEWSPDSGLDVGFTHDNSPYVTIYQWSPSTGFVAKWADPSTALTSNGRDLAWNPDENAIAITTVGGTYINVYEWDFNTGFGTKYSAPSSAPTNAMNAVMWNKDGADIAIGGTTSGGAIYFNVYKWSSGFSTKYSDPATTITGSPSVGGTRFSN